MKNKSKVLMLPISGEGSRFQKVGYSQKKQMLELADGLSCISASLASIKNIADLNILVGVRDPELEVVITEALSSFPGLEFSVLVTGKTPSPVHTISKILDTFYVNESSTVSCFTLDLQIIPPVQIPDYDYYTCTFKANSDNYSYVVTDDNNNVVEWAEKQVISQYANVGLYGLGTVGWLKSACSELITSYAKHQTELSIVELYKFVNTRPIKNILLTGSQIYIFGTPNEYEFVKKYVYEHNQNKSFVIFSDHSGHALKSRIVKILSEMSIPFKDVGTDNKSDSDYSTYAKLALNVSNKSGGIIIGICRSGQGVNIAINKLSDKICALIRKPWSVKLAREHNCATAFALSEEALIDLSDKQLREMLLDMFMPFEGGRHSNRLIEVLNEHN